MRLDALFERFSRFPSLVWIYLSGTFLTRGSYFMVWPFMAIILHRQFELSATQVGLILSVSAIFSALIGFFVANLSDRFGRRRILLLGGLLGLTAFVLLALASQIWVYIVAIGLSATSRALWDPTSKALVGDLLPQAGDREFTLQLSYFCTNAGAAVGPLIGVSLGLSAQQQTFFITASAYGLLILAMWWGFNRHRRLLSQQPLSQHNFAQTLKIFSQDHLFLMLIVANLLVMFVYAHSESSLIQYLTLAKTPHLITLITAMVVTNSLTIVLFQFPLLHWMRSYSLHSRIYIGLALLLVSQLLFSYNPTSQFWPWIVAMFILSLGETILFPTMNIQIDRLAPTRLRGSYFGATSFYSLGFASAPVIGGWLIDQFGGPILFELTSLLTLSVYGCYLLSKDLKRPDNIALESTVSR